MAGVQYIIDSVVRELAFDETMTKKYGWAHATNWRIRKGGKMEKWLRTGPHSHFNGMFGLQLDTTQVNFFLDRAGTVAKNESSLINFWNIGIRI